MSELHTIMLSALQLYSYCPRQCALIHQEQIFWVTVDADNLPNGVELLRKVG